MTELAVAETNVFADAISHNAGLLVGTATGTVSPTPKQTIYTTSASEDVEVADFVVDTLWDSLKALS